MQCRATLIPSHHQVFCEGIFYLSVPALSLMGLENMQSTHLAGGLAAGTGVHGMSLWAGNTKL